MLFAVHSFMLVLSLIEIGIASEYELMYQEPPRLFTITSNSSMDRAEKYNDPGPNYRDVMGVDAVFESPLIDFFRRTTEPTEPKFEDPISAPQNVNLSNVQLIASNQSIRLENVTLHNFKDFQTFVEEGDVAKDPERQIRCSTRTSALTLTGLLILSDANYTLTINFTNVTFHFHQRIIEDKPNRESNFIQREIRERFTYDTFSVSIYPQNLYVSKLNESELMDSVWQRFADKWLLHIAELLKIYRFGAKVQQQRDLIRKVETRTFFQRMCSILKSGPEEIKSDSFIAYGNKLQKTTIHHTRLKGFTRFTNCFGDTKLMKVMRGNPFFLMTHNLIMTVEYDANNTLLSSVKEISNISANQQSDKPVVIPCQSYFVRKIVLRFTLQCRYAVRDLMRFRQIVLRFSLRYRYAVRDFMRFFLNHLSMDGVEANKGDNTVHCKIDDLQQNIRFYLDALISSYFLLTFSKL